MSPTEPSTPVRRSVLEAIHAARGASWVSPTVRWPVPATGTAADVEAATGAVALAEVGPREVRAVGGARLRAALTGASLPFTPGIIERSGGVELWGVAPDEAWLVGDRGLDAQVSALRAGGALVSDIGAGLTHLRLSGPAARSVLQEVCAVDLSASMVADGAIVHAPVAGIRVTLVRQDAGGGPAFTVLVPRDLAESLWEALIHAGAAP